MSVELGKHGTAIWAAYGADGLDAGSQALIRELARCADTLDRLNDLVTGRQESWISLVSDGMGEIQLSIDKVLDERRNHQLALKALYSELRMAGIKPSSGLAADEEPKDMLAVLRKQKEERERQSG
jgi:hypothetical protein